MQACYLDRRPSPRVRFLFSLSCFFLHDISKTDAVRIIKLDTECSAMSPGKPCILESRSRVTKKHCRRRRHESLRVCKCWFEYWFESSRCVSDILSDIDLRCGDRKRSIAHSVLTCRNLYEDTGYRTVPVSSANTQAVCYATKQQEGQTFCAPKRVFIRPKRSISSGELWKYSTVQKVFTRSDITPPKVNGFG